MKALGWWLMLVGFLRLASVWFGFFDIWALRLAVFSNTTMTEVHGRTFGVWTLLTCTLCVLCAFNLDNKPLYLATFLSFVYALGHFLTEYLIYQTMAIANLTTVGIFAVSAIGQNLQLELVKHVNNLDAVAVECTSTGPSQGFLKMDNPITPYCKNRGLMFH
ncbi:hypothetical protein Patl1_08753 [Pistacia atlantica]|uniref:Uncharacterized protein n=1 Tax=Pistacia atlantica TaxID=434234 RepID=A0ACC1AK12_9ROSI|nr:hypothetical protein Patl1_08753 [Pistacia atlantica]